MIPLFKVMMAPGVEDRVVETLHSGYIGEGPRVAEFEKALEPVLGAQVLCTNSCTSALDLAYHLIGFGHGDEVICTPMTCLATTMPLALRGCKIVWADVDELTGNICLNDVLAKITPETKAIICVDWAGRPCDYPLLRSQMPRHIPIVEDAAHAFGASLADLPLGLIGGDYIAWSFQAIKHLTTGDGGALKTLPREHERARLLRWYGLDRRDSTAMRCLQQAPEPGFKYQMNDIAASIGLANLPEAVASVKIRRWNARYYDAFLPREFTAAYDPGASYWLYTILVPERDAFISYMEREGVQVSMVHSRNDLQDIYREWRVSLPGLDRFSERQVSIPVGPWLGVADLEHVVSLIRAWASDHGITVERHESVHA